MSARLFVFRVTHIDIARHRRVLLVPAPGQRQAAAWAEQIHGDARYLSCIRLPKGLAA